MAGTRPRASVETRRKCRTGVKCKGLGASIRIVAAIIKYMICQLKHVTGKMKWRKVKHVAGETETMIKGDDDRER